MFKHLQQFGLASLFALVIFIFISLLNYIIQGDLSLEQLKTYAIITFSYAYPLHFVNAYGFYLAKKIGERNNLNRWKSALAGLPFIIIINIVTIKLVQIGLASFVFKEDINFGENFWEQIKSPFIISLIIGASVYLFHFIVAYQKSRLKQQKEKVSQITQSHEALKSQIGPHFLFNSLNVLSGLVDENPAKAQDFIADLAQVYRYVLDQKSKDWVELTEEINFAKNYIDLIHTRFENGLEVEIDESLIDIDALIAPLSLQLLLENCIKHNALSEQDPLRIRISKEKDYLIVENNLNLKRVLSHRKGTGLENIKNRYASVGYHVEIDKSATSFKVKIPLLNQNLIQLNTQHNFTESEMRMAREEVRDRTAFFGNLIAYILICSIALIINIQNGGYLWAIWPIIGWGTGVLFHGLGTFVFNKNYNKTYSWEEEQARKLLEKRERNNLS